MQADIAPLQADIAPLQADIVPLQADIAPLQADIAPLQADIVPLQADIVPLQADIGPLQADFAPLARKKMPDPARSCHKRVRVSIVRHAFWRKPAFFLLCNVNMPQKQLLFLLCTLAKVLCVIAEQEKLSAAY
ncbi:hypothetical protein [Geomonas subterranea]|uniref:hypothetical protein n=1 Tax=Geomonas subterranea TaxID=2847989 RepID=UPI001CD33639|nr:hypothetical protein [Geomonas fuzhouensis]